MTKRRGNGEGSISQRKDGRFMAQLRLPNGKRITKYGNTKQEIKDWLTVQKKQAMDGLYVSDAGMTFAQLSERYYRDVASISLQEKTRMNYESQVKIHVLPEIGSIKLSKLQPQHLQALYRKKIEQGKAPATVIGYHNRIHKILQQGVIWGLVVRNVADMVERPRLSTKKVTVLTVEQANQFLAHVKQEDDKLWAIIEKGKPNTRKGTARQGNDKSYEEAVYTPKLYALYVVAIMMGLRQGELLGLKWEDIDLLNKRLTVSHSLQYIPHKGQIRKEPKTKSSYRTIPIPPMAYDALVELRAKSMVTDYVFATSTGTPYFSRAILKYFQRSLDECDLPHMRFHDLRHTCASFHLAQGTNPKVVQQILGHANIGITLQTYSHLLPGVGEEAASRINDLLTVKKE